MFNVCNVRFTSVEENNRSRRLQNFVSGGPVCSHKNIFELTDTVCTQRDFDSAATMRKIETPHWVGSICSFVLIGVEKRIVYSAARSSTQSPQTKRNPSFLNKHAAAVRTSFVIIARSFLCKAPKCWMIYSHPD